MKQYEPEPSASKAIARLVLMIGGIIIMVFGLISMIVTGNIVSGLMLTSLGFIMSIVGGLGVKVKESKDKVTDGQINVLDSNKKSQELCVICKSKEQSKCYMCNECYTRAQDNNK